MKQRCKNDAAVRRSKQRSAYHLNPAHDTAAVAVVEVAHDKAVPAVASHSDDRKVEMRQGRSKLRLRVDALEPESAAE
jgi:hypothetical protein